MSGNEEGTDVNRLLIAIVALAFLSAGLVLWEVTPERQGLRSGCLRIGLVMGAIWLALPSRGRAAAWSGYSFALLVAVIAGAMALAVPRFRILIPLLIVLAIVGYVLKPRKPKRTGSGP